MVTWQDIVLIVEFGVIVYIAWEDRLIRQVEEKSLKLYSDYFLERKKWYQARGKGAKSPAASSPASAGSADPQAEASLPVEDPALASSPVPYKDSSVEPPPQPATEKIASPLPAPHTPDLE